MNMNILRLLTIFLALWVTACGRGSLPICVMGDDFGDVVSKEVQVSPVNPDADVQPEWIDTGLDVYAPRSLQISSTGLIQLCKPMVSKSVYVDGRRGVWVDTGIDISNDLPVVVKDITGVFSFGGGPRHNGHGVHMYIGPPDELPERSAVRNYINNSESPGEGKYVAAMHNNLGNHGMNAEGRVFLAMFDSHYGDNSGGFTFELEYFNANCIGQMGEFMQASIGTSPGLGEIKDLTSYAHVQEGSESLIGVFNEHAWSTGRLWLRIVEDPTKRDWPGHEGQTIGDGSFTQLSIEGFPDNTSCNYNVEHLLRSGQSVPIYTGSNCGKYNVNVVTTRPFDDDISNILNRMVDPVKKMLLGDATSADPDDWGITRRLYYNITNNGQYVAAVRAAMALAVVLYAFGFVLGLTRASADQLIFFVLKIGIVATMIGPDSWEFFYHHLFRIFIEGTDDLIWIMSGQYGDAFNDIDLPQTAEFFTPRFFPEYLAAVGDGWPTGSLNGVEGVYFDPSGGQTPASVTMSDDPDQYFVAANPSYYNVAMEKGGLVGTLDGIEGVFFDQGSFTKTDSVSTDSFAYLNQTLSRFFSVPTNLKIMALISSFPVGWLFALLIYFSIFFFVFAIARVVVTYILAIIMMSLLLFLAPIFVTFVLFGWTKKLFENYLRMLIQFTLEPVLLFVVLSLFNVFILAIFMAVLSYTVCWQCVWYLDFPFNSWLGIRENFDKFCILENYRPWGTSNSQPLRVKLNNFPVSIFAVIIFTIMVQALDSFLNWVAFVSRLIAGAPFGGVNVFEASGQAIAGAVNTVGETAKTVGKTISAPIEIGMDLAASSKPREKPSTDSSGGASGSGDGIKDVGSKKGGSDG